MAKNVKYYKTGTKSNPQRVDSHLGVIEQTLDIENLAEMETFAENINQEFNDIEGWIRQELDFAEQFLKAKDIPHEMKLYQLNEGKTICGLSTYVKHKFGDVAGASIACESIELLNGALCFLKKNNEVAALKSLYRATKTKHCLPIANMEGYYFSGMKGVENFAKSNLKYSESDKEEALKIFNARGTESMESAYREIKKQLGISRETSIRWVKKLKKNN